MTKVCLQWENLKKLTHDIMAAQEHCMIELEPLAHQSSLPLVKAVFFCYAQKSRFEILFSFADVNGQLFYPHGKWTWSFKSMYGPIT